MAGRPDDWTEEKANELGRELVEWFRKNENHIFWQEFLLLEKALYKDLIQYLLRKFPKSEFARCVDMAKKFQEIRLCNGALNRTLNPTMAIFLTKVHHGYSENGIMGRDLEPVEDDSESLKDKSPQDLLKDVKKQLGKE